MSELSEAQGVPFTSSIHSHKPLEFGAMEHFKLSHLEGGINRQNSIMSWSCMALDLSAEGGSGSEFGYGNHGSGSSQTQYSMPLSSVHSIYLQKHPDPTDHMVTLMMQNTPSAIKVTTTSQVLL